MWQKNIERRLRRATGHFHERGHRVVAADLHRFLTQGAGLEAALLERKR